MGLVDLLMKKLPMSKTHCQVQIIKKTFRAKSSVTDCGSVASGSVTTNLVTKQGIPTSNRFSALIEVPQEDNCASFQDDLSSYLGNSHDSRTTPTRTIVSVTSRSVRVPSASGLKT